MFEAHPAAGCAQRHTDDKPDPDNGEHGSEWYRSTRSFGPDKQVEKEESAEDDARHQHWSDRNVQLPVLSTKSFVCSRRYVPTNEAEEGIQEQNHSSKKPSIRRG